VHADGPDPLATPSSLGIVVLTFGTTLESLPLVQSLLEEGYPPDSVVIVHNPAEPREPTIEPPHPDVAVLRPHVNLGYAAGMNLGIDHQRRRKADVIALLTHDVRFRAGALAVMRQALGRSPAFGVLGPVLWMRGENRPFSFGGLTSPTGRTTHLSDRASDVAGVAETDWVDGSAMVIRSAVIDAVGGLDERFFMYCEESEFCLRAVRAGWKVGVAVDAVAAQSPGQSKRPGAHAYLLTRNGLEYARRAKGARGVAGGLGRAMYQVAVDVRRILGAKAGHRSPARAAESYPRIVGTSRGVADFLRRRWGAPPATLPGLGDYRDTGSNPA
jgi:N-acetylglucosaminyl-diphospho-decaprenol L-rhamnosyltransferase